MVGKPFHFIFHDNCNNCHKKRALSIKKRFKKSVQFYQETLKKICLQKGPLGACLGGPVRGNIKVEGSQLTWNSISYLILLSLHLDLIDWIELCVLIPTFLRLVFF